MSSLLTQEEKDSLALDFKSVAETFERPIVAYHEAKRVVISTDPNFSPVNAANQNNRKVQNVPVTQTLQARVLYAEKQLNPIIPIGADQNKLRMADGMVRIKVREEGYTFLGKAKKVELDGQLFDVDSVERPHGLFSAEYYTYWLKRSQ